MVPEPSGFYKLTPLARSLLAHPAHKNNVDLQRVQVLIARANLNEYNFKVERAHLDAA